MGQLGVLVSRVDHVSRESALARTHEGTVCTCIIIHLFIISACPSLSFSKAHLLCPGWLTGRQRWCEGAEARQFNMQDDYMVVHVS